MDMVSPGIYTKERDCNDILYPVMTKPQMEKMYFGGLPLEEVRDIIKKLHPENFV